MPVCVSVRLSVCRLACTRNTRINFTNYCSVHGTCCRGSVLSWRRWSTLCVLSVLRATSSLPIGNESVPKMIINDRTGLFFTNAVSIVVISNHNSFRVLFIKIVSVYFISKIYYYFSIGNGQPMEPALCHLYRHTSSL